MSARFSLGIDLGTTNSAAAVTDLAADDTSIVEMLQALGPSQLGGKPTLPSALYLPHPEEFPEGSFRLPWAGAEERAVIGEFARDHGAQVPDRLVTSAKSWLSNPHIDPRQATLPWRSETVEQKLSPLECSRRYLEHLKEAFLYAERERGSDWEFGDGQIVATVPASFDEVARSLTADAAEAAGLGKVTLLEEPLAAFYAWTAHTGRSWHNLVSAGDLILVCDIGGGTADFSLIAVNDIEGSLALERISVGEHILLGGDNLDLALAYALQAKLAAGGKTLDAWQFAALVHAVSKAKITLFEEQELAEARIAVPSRGSSLFAGTIATSLDRQTLERIVVDGFFPRTGIDDLPREGRSTGLQEFGLPYASDPVISKHLAQFLVRSLQNVRASDKLSGLVGTHVDVAALMPTAVLFNGGVFKAGQIRARVLELLASWNGGEPVRELAGFEPDLAVARG
ncbi:MAG: Hsp70 family protein, partial [Acetobacteraceae bacterium]|nr:Hsp70 family protein [Acetobacteraceae bacterium]